MNVIVALDDRNGMMFNHRRQSRDRVMNERILALCGGTLRLNAVSAKLFEGIVSAHLTVSDRFLDEAGEDDWCFAEDTILKPYEGRIGKLVVFRWNRLYPSDRTFDLNLAEWTLVSQVDFAGSSHDRITEEVYTK